MSHGHDVRIPEPPAPIRFPAWAWALAGLAAAGGVAGFAAALARGEAEQAWGAYLIGAFFTLGLGAFGALWMAMLYLGKAAWSVGTRRVLEAMAAWLLPGGVAILALGAFGLPHVYEWAHPDVVAADPKLLHKAVFLNPTTFLVFSAIAVGGWALLASRMVGHSLAQDRTGSSRHTRRNVALSAVFSVFFALTFSGLSFLLLMSLEPHWASTMLAVLTWTDLMQTGLAVQCLAMAILVARGRLPGFATAEHLHSAGKLLFAFTGFWAYIWFCQFLLIWYGNLPEEAAYYARRLSNGWEPYLLALPIVKFAVPFLWLVPLAAKRRPARLIPAAILVILAEFLELYVMVAPAVGGGEEAPPAHFPVLELAVTAGFAGLFFLVFAWTLSRRQPVPLKDPAIEACLEYR
jgi:hypothetical protein